MLPAGIVGCGGSEQLADSSKQVQAAIHIIPFYGQSNSTGAVDFSQTWRTPTLWGESPSGYAGTLDGNASITTTSESRVLTLRADYTSLAQLSGLPFGFSGEGAVHGMLEAIATAYPAHTMMTFSGGVGGAGITALDKPSTAEIAALPAETAERQIAAAGQTLASLTDYSIFDCGTYYYVFMWLLSRSAKLVRDQRRRPIVSALVWQQGESDGGDAAVYPALFAQLCQDLAADIRDITGQSEGVVILAETINYSTSLELPSQKGYETWAASGYRDLTGYRTESARINDMFDWDVQHDQSAVALSQASPHSPVCMVAPRYPHSNRIHMHPHAARAHGEQFGKVYRKVVIEGQPWEPVRPVSWWISGSKIYLRFSVPEGSLQFTIPPQGNTHLIDPAMPYGFEHSAGAIAQANVVIVEPDLICIEPNVIPTLGQSLHYCKSVRYGSLCDSDSTVARFTDRTGAANALRNYCQPFSVTL